MSVASPAPTSPTAGNHLGYAEHGKQLAIAGRHREALAAYRVALAAASAADPATRLLCRHYTECALESLEHLGAHDAVIAYCDQALDHYAQHPPAGPLAAKDLASLHQRRAALRLKQGDPDTARADLRVALELARAHGFTLPLAATLARWIDTRLTVTPERIHAEQKHHGYYAVRPDTLRPELIVPVPPALLSATQP